MIQRILVVDDDQTSNQFLTLLLQCEGFEVRSALSADEALKVAESFQPDALIADWLLKDGLDGAEVARALRERLPALQIIFATGSPAEHLQEQVRGLQPVTILEKPIEIDDV